jgi:hypothetical protein
MNAMTDTRSISLAGNPFLEALEPYLSTNDLETRLQNWPLAGLDVPNLSITARHDLLDLLQEQMFEPTLTSLDTTTRLYRMIRRGYIARDPTQVSSRAHLMAVARHAGKELKDLPWFPHWAKCMRVSGITGLGKTYELLRALEQLPKTFVHGHSSTADWNHMTQISWLYVAMSHDGSLGGLLLQILVEVDARAGTRYAEDPGLTRLSNEKLAVHVGIILNNHAVGVLVFDELQGRNFAGGNRGGLAATFFLRLLNFGIPLVLMGNPLGMDALDRFSQDMRRVGSAGNIEMHPMTKDEFDYTDVLAPALWRYDIMPQPCEVDDKDGAILFHFCGGIRSYGARIRVASQRLALDQGDKSVTEVHMRQAFMGPDFSSRDRQLIAGFRDQNPLLLMNFDDIPWERYAQRWGCYPGSEEAKKVDIQTDEPPSTQGTTKIERKPLAQQAAQSAACRRTRAKNQEANNAALQADLETDDMRNKGLQEYLITGIGLMQNPDTQGVTLTKGN